MEFLTIFLSSLLGIVSPAGVVIDRTAENAIRSQFAKVEQLQVRVDNVPTYQLLQGKVERVRIAGRSMHLKWQNIRIAVLELETDPINFDLPSLRQGQRKLNSPLQAGVRLVLTEADINQALQSPAILERLRKFKINLPAANAESSEGYGVVNPRVEFLANNRLRLQVELQQQGGANPLFINLESGLLVESGRSLQLVEPVVLVNGKAFPEPFVRAIANNFSKRLDLRNLEGYGLLARLLKLNIDKQELEIAAFVKVNPDSRFLQRR